MSTYIGRFAPTPSGPLHFGSLIAAVGSYCAAKQAQGRWTVRMDDLDGPRNMPGAADQILRCLEAYGLYWDGEVVYQSQHQEDYQAALQSLIESGLCYPCACTRKSIGTGPYPGTCASGLAAGQKERSLRIRVPDQAIEFLDGLQGQQTHDLGKECGDFILRRADKVISYHLATVLDDARQGVTHVMRGADLLSSTARQLFLQQRLGLPTPEYSHLPVICSADGRKLSKQNHAHALSPQQARQLLARALSLLGQRIPDSPDLTPQELLELAVSHWQRADLPHEQSLMLCSEGAG